MLITENGLMFIAYLIFWGMAVVADSPLFSTLVANNVNQESKGTALTIVNSIGFSITIISIQILNIISQIMNQQMVYIFLAIGPLLGLLALNNRRQKNTAGSFS
jgi:hypothetical protein